VQNFGEKEKGKKWGGADRHAGSSKGKDTPEQKQQSSAPQKDL